MPICIGQRPNRIGVAGVRSNCIGVRSNRVGVRSNRIGVRSNHNGVRSNRIGVAGVRSSHIGVKSNRVGVRSNRIVVRLNRIGLRSTRIGVTSRYAEPFAARSAVVTPVRARTRTLSTSPSLFPPLARSLFQNLNPKPQSSRSGNVAVHSGPEIKTPNPNHEPNTLNPES